VRRGANTGDRRRQLRPALSEFATSENDVVSFPQRVKLGSGRARRSGSTACRIECSPRRARTIVPTWVGRRVPVHPVRSGRTAGRDQGRRNFTALLGGAGATAWLAGDGGADGIKVELSNARRDPLHAALRPDIRILSSD